MRGYAALFFGTILIAVFVLKEYSAGVSSFFQMTPWWMYFVVCGIIYSGYRAYTGIHLEKSQEKIAIEAEGKVYMDRIAAKTKKANLIENEPEVDETEAPKASGE